MPGQFYSDKYIKRQRGAEEAKDNLETAKNIKEQTLSEEREAARRFKKEAADRGDENAEKQ